MLELVKDTTILMSKINISFQPSNLQMIANETAFLLNFLIARLHLAA